MEYIAVFLNGSSDGKIMKRVENAKELLMSASKALKINLCPGCVYTPQGYKLSQDAKLDRNQIFYVSAKDEPFLPLQLGDETMEEDKPAKVNEQWVRLNVGGTHFTTTRPTLLKCESSMLAKMFDSPMEPSSIDSTGAYLIDRDPKVFAILLNYLRTGKLFVGKEVSYEELLTEADYFGIESLSSDATGLHKHITHEDLKSTLEVRPKEKLQCLKYMNFTRCNLNNLDLSFLDLRGACFRKCDMVRTNLSNCNLEGADFQEADMRCCRLENSKLYQTNLQRANLSNAEFVACTMLQANLRNAALYHATLKNCTMARVNLKSANLTHCYLVNSSLDSAILEETNCSRAILNKISGAKVSFKGAKMRNAVFINCDMFGADFSDADLQTDENDASMDEVAYLKTYIDRKYTNEKQPPTHASCSNFKEANFSNAVLQGRKLIHCQLTDADLSDADLSGSDLTGCYIDMNKRFKIDDQCIRWLLNGAVLRNANMQHCDLRYCLLDGAILKGACISGIVVDEVKLAILDELAEEN